MGTNEHWRIDKPLLISSTVFDFRSHPERLVEIIGPSGQESRNAQKGKVRSRVGSCRLSLVTYISASTTTESGARRPGL